MLSFRRKSTLAVAGKADVASPPLPTSAIAEAKDNGHDDDIGDIFSAVLSSARTSQQPAPAAAAAADDEQSKEGKPKDEEKEKDGKHSPPPLAYIERAPHPAPSLPSLERSEITPDTLRAISAVHAVDRYGGLEEQSDAEQQPPQHERKTSSTALIAEILGNRAAAATAAPAVLSTAQAPTTILSPPPLLSGASMTIQSQERKELPRISMREVYGEVERSSPTAPPPTPAAAFPAPSKSPPPTPQRTLPPTPPPVPPPYAPPAPALSSNPFADAAPPAPPIPSTARLPSTPFLAPSPRSPPPRPLPLSVAASPARAEGEPAAGMAAGMGGGVGGGMVGGGGGGVNPFDEVEGGAAGAGEGAEGVAGAGVAVAGRAWCGVAVAAYSASAPDQLSCAKGDVLDVVDDSHASWTMVRNARGVQGLVPATYVRKQRRDDEEGVPAVVAMPPPAPRQPSNASHRRIASQPPAIPSPATSPPPISSRLPPASPNALSVPTALRLQPPSPSSHPAPPALPRPLSSPSSSTTPASPMALSPPPHAPRARAPSLPTPPVARLAVSASLPASASFTSVPGAGSESGAAVAAMEVCEAAHSYSAVAADQLSMSVGEKLLLVSRNHPHWWKVVNGAGETGLVPTSYIKLLTDTPPSASASGTLSSRPPPTPSALSVPLSPPNASVPGSAPPLLMQARSLPLPPPSPASRPSPPAALPALPAPPQPPLPPPISIPHPGRQIQQQQLATTPTAASMSAHSSAAPQHRHSMSLNTISAPIKPALPTALTASVAPASPAARAASFDPPSFPLPPTPAARNSPLPSPAARLPAPATLPAGAAASALVAERGEAVHSFDAADGVQLSVSRGDQLMIVQRLDTGWAVCRLLHTGITGLVPTSYIRSTTERPAAG